MENTVVCKYYLLNNYLTFTGMTSTENNFFFLLSSDKYVSMKNIFCPSN